MTARRLAAFLLAAPLGFVAVIGVEALIARQQPGVPYTDPPRAPQRYGDAGPELELVVLGDSTAVGQGADYEDGIAVALARHLARERRVTLTNLAISGSTADDLLRDQVEPAARRSPHLVLIAIGANDTTALRSTATVKDDLERTIARLEQNNCDTRIVLTGSPDLGGARVAAQPLRWLLGVLGARTNATAIEPLADRPRVTFAPVARNTGALFREDDSLFSADGFHPSARGYATWMPTLTRAADEALAAPSKRGCR